MTEDILRELAAVAEDLQRTATSLERIAAGADGAAARSGATRTAADRTAEQRLERAIGENTRSLKDTTAALKRISELVNTMIETRGNFVAVGE